MKRCHVYYTMQGKDTKNFKEKEELVLVKLCRQGGGQSQQRPGQGKKAAP